jgi:hypothetical protein
VISSHFNFLFPFFIANAIYYEEQDRELEPEPSLHADMQSSNRRSHWIRVACCAWLKLSKSSLPTYKPSHSRRVHHFGTGNKLITSAPRTAGHALVYDGYRIAHEASHDDPTLRNNSLLRTDIQPPGALPAAFSNYCLPRFLWIPAATAYHVRAATASHTTRLRTTDLEPTAAWDHPGSIMLHVVEALQVEPVSLQALPRAAYTIRNNTRLLPLISQQEYCNAPKPTTLPHSCLRRLHGQMDQIMDRRTSQCPLQDNSGVLCPDPRFSLRCRGF